MNSICLNEILLSAQLYLLLLIQSIYLTCVHETKSDV